MPLAKCVREESVDAEHPPPTTPRAVTSPAADPSPGVEQTKEAAPPRRVLVVPLPAGRRNIVAVRSGPCWQKRGTDSCRLSFVRSTTSAGPREEGSSRVGRRLGG